jgi:hypothetical protein
VNHEPKAKLASISIVIIVSMVLLTTAAIAQSDQARPASAALASHTTSLGTVLIKRTREGQFARSGELVACGPDEIVLETRLTYFEFAGICSDERGPACGGRLVSLTETCVADPASMQESAHVQSRTRICFDPTGRGACNEREQVALIANTSTSEGASNTLRNRTEVHAARAFEMDGRQVRILPGPMLVSGAM